MGTKDKPGKFDCYLNAARDEPMFILLGRDPDAGALVRAWALSRSSVGEDPEVIGEAMRCADDLEAYCRSLGKTPRCLISRIESALSIQSTRLLGKIAERGIYGRNVAEVAARFVDEALARFVTPRKLTLRREK